MSVGKRRANRESVIVWDANCPVGKTAFRNRDDAAKRGRQVNAERVYVGKCCGHWHITMSDEGEYSRTIAALVASRKPRPVSPAADIMRQIAQASRKEPT